MAGKTIDGVLAELEQVLRVWRDNPTFSLGDTTRANVETLATSLRAKKTETEDTRTLLTRLVNESNALMGQATQFTTRIRGGMRATFGPDSSQYDQAGGTRVSERKKPVPKKKT
jgi:hypothetical protein